MEKLYVNFEEIIGKIKAMHGIGQPPLGSWGFGIEHFHYLKEAHIPFSRLHDVGGVFGGNLWVDIPNIFRDFDADENMEENYDFAFTDILVKGLVENGCYPVFRLGVTIEQTHRVKAYRIFPPADFGKWARICEHIIRHYNCGWAEGFYLDIKYWEIWNEADHGPTPERNAMWKGTPEQFYEMYTVAAKHLKNCFGDSIKVGGYASSGLGYVLSYPEKFGMDWVPEHTDGYTTDRGEYMANFFLGFLEYISAHKAPLDFFSWHAYGLETEQMVKCTYYIDKKLAEYGYGHAENQLNEYSIEPAAKYQGTCTAAARCTAIMCAMQNTSTNILCLYDARMSASIYAAVFNSITKMPYPMYYALKAFGELYMLENQVQAEITGDGLYVQAAGKDDRKAVLICNISEEAKEIETNLEADMKGYIIEEGHMLEEVEIDTKGFVLPANSVILFSNVEE